MGKEEISKELEGVDVDNETDDYFESVLKDENLKPPTDDNNDAGTDTSDKNVADQSEGKGSAKPTYDELQAKIAQLEKDQKGKLSDVVKSRKEKATMKAELNELKSAVSSLLETRKTKLEDTESSEAAKKELLEDTERNIQFRDDDSAFVDLTDVKEKIETDTKQTRQELAELKAERAREVAKQTFNDNVNMIIGENEDSFKPAYDYLKDVYKDLNDAVIALQLRTGMEGDENGAIDQDVALDAMAGTEEEKLFLEKHPNIDPTRVARAFNTKVDLRSSLKHLSDIKSFGKSKEATGDRLDDKLKAAKDKPSGLGRTENQASGNSNLVERIASLGTDDIMDFNDAEAAKVEAMLQREALKGE